MLLAQLERIFLWSDEGTSDFHVKLLDGIALLEHFGRRELTSFGYFSHL